MVGSHEVSRVKGRKSLNSWNLTNLPFALAIIRRTLSWSCQVKTPILLFGPLRPANNAGCFAQSATNFSDNL